jgi:hypothetical protein
MIHKFLGYLFKHEANINELRSQLRAGKSISKDLDRALRNRCSFEQTRTLQLGKADSYFDDG